MWDENKDFKEGTGFRERGNYFEAFKSFDRAKEQHNGIPQYWHCAGHMLILNGDNKKAADYLEKAVDLYDKNNHEECFWTGAAYALLNDKENSYKYLKKAIRLDSFSNTYRGEALEEEDYSVFSDDPDFIEMTRKRTSEEIDKEFCDFYLEKLNNENTVFKEIDKTDFNHYLAAPFFKKLWIRKDKAGNLDPFIKDYYLEIVKDPEGNIMDINAPSDMWQIELFEVPARFMEKDSFMLFIDDTEIFFKVEFGNKQVKYFIQMNQVKS